MNMNCHAGSFTGVGLRSLWPLRNVRRTDICRRASFVYPCTSCTLIVQALSAGSRMRRSRKPSYSQRAMMTLLALVSMPRVPFVSGVMLSLCGLVLLMVGMLCVRHWLLAARGNTYIGSLKGESVADGGTLLCQPAVLIAR